MMLLIVVGLVASCGTSNDAGEHAEMDHNLVGGQGEVPGMEANPSEADRRIEIEAFDDLRFEPSSVEAAAGEVITFVVHNGGKTQHEFVLGDEAYQEAHEEDMMQGRHMMDMANLISLAPGETKELTWKFSDAGEVLFGCHEPGHYEGGMVGIIAVREMQHG